MHYLIFPDDEWEGKNNEHWVAWDNTESPVGFCSLRPIRHESAVFLSRAGVLPCARGNRLQRRFIAVREAWARRNDFGVALTYCLYENHSSLANLIKSGYRLYEPEYQWVGRDVHYFIKEL